MFRIGKLFHFTHVVDDLDAADQWYDDVFAPCRFYRAYMKAAAREASLLAIGDTVMEPVQLAGDRAAESPIGKFRARYGQAAHSIAWYVDSIDETFRALDECGIRIYDLVGRKIQEPRHARGAVWTHPKDTYALLEFAEVPRFTIDPRLQRHWSDSFWRDEHPLAIDGLSHMTVIVPDLASGRRVYGEALRGEILDERDDRAYFAVGDGSVVEAVVGRDAGSGIAGLTFRTVDLNGAASFLGVAAEEPVTIEAFGMAIHFTAHDVRSRNR